MARTMIAIPAYNCEDAIRASLESCLAQTRPTEVFVVDNCSTDRTREVVAEFAERGPLVRLCRNEKNLGRVGNWNRCLELLRESEYEYIKFLFSGDTLKPQCIERVECVVERYPDVGAVFWPYEFCRGSQYEVFRHYQHSCYLPPEEINELNIAEGGRLGAIVCNVYSRAAIGDTAFNEAFVGKADFDYRVLRKHGAYYLNEVLSSFHVEHHGTFESALNNYCVNIEASFNRCCALERCQADLTPEKHAELRAKIIADTFRENLDLLSTRQLMSLTRRVGRTLARRLRERGRVAPPGRARQRPAGVGTR
ncbi:MAG: glycosyltransferase family 2 protein [Planctomycetes bacterium]|nr:glycosyltransferase family 2 protein [Planctomycetota bacterium]